MGYGSPQAHGPGGQAGRRLKQLRIAAASDLHLGNIVGKRHLQKLVRKINAMQPDVILLPGDVLDDSIEPFLRNNLGDTMKQLKAKHGVYAILGNHEYYGRSIETYTQVMHKIGIKVLQDETVELAGGYYVAGRKDRSAEAMDPKGRLSSAELLSGLDLSRQSYCWTTSLMNSGGQRRREPTCCFAVIHTAARLPRTT